MGLNRVGIVRDGIYLEDFYTAVDICLIGPDGSGKYTVSSHLLENMKDLFEDIRYYHGHYQILPDLSRLLLIKQKNVKSKILPVKKKKKKRPLEYYNG